MIVGSISNGFRATESREVSLIENIYNFSVDHSSIDKSDILNIHKYLMVKNNIKKTLRLIRQVFIGLLCFSKSLSSITNTPDHVKCTSLINQQCMS